MTIIEAVAHYWEENDLPPSFRDIVGLTGICLSMVHKEIHRLYKQGRLHGTPGRARSIKRPDLPSAKKS